MTEDELVREPGAVATRSDEAPVEDSAEVVFTPMDFRLNLQARLAEPLELLTNLDSPSIRKLTWEQVVPERSETAPEAETPATVAPDVPLPAPRRVLPPLPPLPAMPFEPRVSVEPPISEDTPEVVVEAVAPAPVIEDRVETQPESSVVDVEPPVEPAAPVEEINRLASVPDMVVDDSPIELPPITPSGPVVPASSPVVPPVRSLYTPVLPETLFAVSPRPTPPNIAAIVAESNMARHRSTRKHKRHLFRSFVSLLMVFGLLGGGAFAAKKYLLREPQWPAELQPLADEVATTRGLEFKATVEVKPVPVADYATRLAISALGEPGDRAATWRSLGLLSGELDMEAIGRQALNDAPAFYDPSTKTVFVSDDLTKYEHLYRFAIRRALASALLDQRFDWSTRLVDASPAAALALRATIDADALAVANTLAAGDAPDQLAPELFTFVQAHGNALAPSQYAATLAGRVGVAMRPSIAALAGDPDALKTLETAMPSSDASFDGARPESAVPTAPEAQGMMFWYYVLASRIDDTQAWSAAVNWSGDSLTSSEATDAPCVDATVAAADADGAKTLLAAFESWAAAAPAESSTTVAAGDNNQVMIRACDPGAAVSSQVVTKVPVVFGGAGVEGALVQAAVSAATDTKVDAACLIAAARQRGTALASPADDAPVLAVDWKPAYVAANLDLATGCVAASTPPAAG